MGGALGGQEDYGGGGVRERVVERILGAVKDGLSLRDALVDVDRMLRKEAAPEVSLEESCRAVGILEARHGRFKGNEVKED